MSEIKKIVDHYKPHLFGISECELRKSENSSQESRLKIPGYDLIFPKSWSKHGFARVVLYVKSTLDYIQVHELEDELVQSIWIKGGFKNMKQILFCHTYREHTNTLGNTIQNQKDYLKILLSQWESASFAANGTEPPEVHVCGDMNIDMLDDKWLHSSLFI